MKVRLNDELFKRNDPNTPRIISVIPVKKPAGTCRSIAEACNDLDRYVYGTFGTLDVDNMLIWERDLFASSTIEAFFTKEGYQFGDRMTIDDSVEISFVNKLIRKLTRVKRLLKIEALRIAMSDGTFLYPLLFAHLDSTVNFSEFDYLLGIIFHNGKYHVLLADTSSYRDYKIGEHKMLELVLAWWAKTPLKGSARPADGRTYRLVTNVVIYGSEDMPVHYIIVFPFNDDERIDTDEQRS